MSLFSSSLPLIPPRYVPPLLPPRPPSSLLLLFISSAVDAYPQSRHTEAHASSSSHHNPPQLHPDPPQSHPHSPQSQPRPITSTPAVPHSPHHNHSSPSKRTKTDQSHLFSDNFPPRSHDSHARSGRSIHRSHNSHVSSYDGSVLSHDYHAAADPSYQLYSPAAQRDSIEYESHDHHMISAQDYITHCNDPTDVRQGYQYEAPPTALPTTTPTRDNYKDFTDGSAPRKTEGPKSQSSHSPLHSGGHLSHHPPKSSQRRGSLGRFSDDYTSSLPQSSTLSTQKFPSPPGGQGGDNISQSSVRYLEVSRSLQEQQACRKRSSATSESDSNGVAMDPEYQHLLPESSDETADRTEEGGREEDGERREFPRSRRGEGNRRRREGEERREESSGRAGRRELVLHSVSRSASEVSSAQHIPQENSSKHPQSVHRSTNSMPDDMLGVTRQQFQSSKISGSPQKPRRPPEHFRIRRSLSQCQKKHYDRMGFGVGLESRRCHSDSETRAGKEKSRLPSTGRPPHHTPPLALHSIPPPIGHIPMIPTWNSIIHTAPASSTESNRSSFQYQHTSTGRGQSDNLSSRQSEFQSSQRMPNVATGDNHRGRRDLRERMTERERSEKRRERETEEPMQVSPNTTRSFEMSDEISEISNSAQVGSGTMLITNTHLSITHTYSSAEGRKGMSASDLSSTADNTIGSKDSHQEQSIGREGNAEVRAASSQGGPQPSVRSESGELVMDCEGGAYVGRRRPHQKSEDHSAIHNSVPSMFPQADIHSTSEGTGRSQLFGFLAGQLPTDMQNESTTPSTLQNAPSASSFHQENPQWYGEDSEKWENSKLPQNVEKAHQTVASVPMDPAIITVYSGPHAMSPIPEASQEFSSQATTTTPNHTSSQLHTQFTQSMHSLSPLDEQGEKQTTRLQRSTSPFRHNALEEVATIARSPTALSDITTPSNTSQLIAADNRSPTPQIEPPSSDTSRSLTRSLEVDSSTQATVHSPNSQERERDHHFENKREQDAARKMDPPLTRLDGYVSFVGTGTEEAGVDHHHMASGEVQQQQHDLLGMRNSGSAIQNTQLDSTSQQDQLLFQCTRNTHLQDTTPTFASDGSDLFTNDGVGETTRERGHPPTAEEDGGGALVHSGAYQNSNVSSEGGSGLRGSTPLSTTSAPPAIAQQSLQGLERSVSPGSCVGSSLSDSVAHRHLGRRPIRSRHRTGPVSERERSWGRGRSEAGERGVRQGGGGGGEGRERGQRIPQQSERRGRGHHHGGAQGSSRIVQDLEMMTRAIEGMDSGRHWEPNQQRSTPQPREDGMGQIRSSIGRDRGRSTRPASCTPHTAGSPQSRLSTNSRQMFRPVTPALATDQARSSLETHQHRFRQMTSHLTSGLSCTDPHPAGQRQREASMQLNLNFQHVPTLHNSPMNLSQIAPSDDSPEPIRNPILELGTPNLAQSGTPPAGHHYNSLLSPPNVPAMSSSNGYQGSSTTRQPQSGTVPPPQSGTVPPPQVASDSFDYLPPYSPPRNARGSQVSQRSAILAAPQGYPDPPPSYEEIFGQQSQSRGSQRQRHASRYSRGRQEELGGRGSSQGHGDGGHRPNSRSSGQRRLSSLTSLFRRNRRHSHDPEVHHTSHHTPSPIPHPLDHTSTAPRPADLQGGSRQGAVQRASQDTASSSPTQPLQRTASWVATYNQTPRPHSVLQQFERSFGEEREGGGDVTSSVSAVSAPTHSAAHSHIPRAASDTTTMNSRLRESQARTMSQLRRHIQLPSNQLPYIPYRHPPPFRPAQSHSQTTTSSAYPLTPPPPPLTRSHVRDFNSSQPNIAATTHATTHATNTDTPTNAQQGHVTPRILPHHQRMRPSSAIVTSSEFGHIFTDFHRYLPEQRLGQHRAFISEEVVESNDLERSENISNSCFNISNVSASGRGGRGGGGGGGGRRGGGGGEESRVTSDGSRSHSTRQAHSVQVGLLGSVEEQNLRANGNANNTNCPTSSPGHAGNHTPSPTFSRRACSSQPGPEEWNTCSSTQPHLHSQTESTTLQTGSTSRRKQSQRSLSQQSTTRTRAATRRRAQQPRSSDEEEEERVSSSQSSQGRQRQRHRRGDTSSQSTSQNSPAPSATPTFFPSFQSQPQPVEVAFSAISTDQLTPTPRDLRNEGLFNGHVTLGEVSHDHLMTSQSHQSQSQLTQDTVLSPPNTSCDQVTFAGESHDPSHISRMILHMLSHMTSHILLCSWWGRRSRAACCGQWSVSWWAAAEPQTAAGPGRPGTRSVVLTESHVYSI